jgi:ATP-dependent Zn protease
MTVFGMAPILWMFIFIVIFAFYLYIFSMNKESPEDEDIKNIKIKNVTENRQENDIANRSSGAWLGIFFLWTIFFLVFSFIIYFFTHFHGM